MNFELRQFRHFHAGHCESGVTASLFTNGGYPISEAMAFGIGSGLFFGYLPFIKIMGLPLITFRSFPGTLFPKVCKRLGVQYFRSKFRNEAEGMRALDERLSRGIPAGMQASIYWLPYFPDPLRIHFNAHNLIAIGKTGSEYRISDPIADVVLNCPETNLRKARYARGGPLVPKGLMYYPVNFPSQFDLIPAIKKGLTETCHRMFYAPFFFGVHGIRLLAKHVVKWPKKLQNERKIQLHFANIVRMQEEIGTGGAGFRFMFAAFLEETALISKRVEFSQLSKEMTAIGDNWRDFAVACSRICKGRVEAGADYQSCSDMLSVIADKEAILYKKIRRLLPLLSGS